MSSDEGAAGVFAVISKLRPAIAPASPTAASTPAEYKVTVANIGDSRAILGRYRAGQLSMIPMSTDHKPSDPKESARIVKAGGSVQAGRVAGSLALSRAFGDRQFKVPHKAAADKYQVIAVPALKVRKSVVEGKSVAGRVDHGGRRIK